MRWVGFWVLNIHWWAMLMLSHVEIVVDVSCHLLDIYTSSVCVNTVPIHHLPHMMSHVSGVKTKVRPQVTWIFWHLLTICWLSHKRIMLLLPMYSKVILMAMCIYIYYCYHLLMYIQYILWFSHMSPIIDSPLRYNPPFPLQAPTSWKLQWCNCR